MAFIEDFKQLAAINHLANHIFIPCKNKIKSPSGNIKKNLLYKLCFFFSQIFFTTAMITEKSRCSFQNMQAVQIK